MATLIHSGCAGKLRRSQVGVKILGEGVLSQLFFFQISREKKS